jgi:hypothetical protein
MGQRWAVRAGFCGHLQEKGDVHVNIVPEIG